MIENLLRQMNGLKDQSTILYQALGGTDSLNSPEEMLKQAARLASVRHSRHASTSSRKGAYTDEAFSSLIELNSLDALPKFHELYVTNQSAKLKIDKFEETFKQLDRVFSQDDDDKNVLEDLR